MASPVWNLNQLNKEIWCGGNITDIVFKGISNWVHILGSFVAFTFALMLSWMSWFLLPQLMVKYHNKLGSLDLDGYLSLFSEGNLWISDLKYLTNFLNTELPFIDNNNNNKEICRYSESLTFWKYVSLKMDQICKIQKIGQDK